VDVVRAAAADGLRVVPQSTGHGAAPLVGRIDDAVLLRLSRFVGVTVDPERRVARVLGATPWHQVVRAASAHGLAALHGSGPDIGALGYTLGGGLSWYARTYGLACNHVAAAEIVRADGRLVRVHADSSPELFWGLRGGGGNFGVVTALELQLFPLEDVFAGVMVWDAARAAEVCRAWADWTHGVGEAATTSLRLLGRTHLAGRHQLFPGRQVVVIDGAVLGDEARAARLIAPLRSLRPEVDTFSMMPARDLPGLHFDPQLPTSTVSEHLLMDDFGTPAADTLVEIAGQNSDTTLLSAEIRHLGGAVGRPAAAGGALDLVPGRYSGYFLAGASTPELAERGAGDTTRAVDALQRWSNGRRFLNFTDKVVDPASAFSSETLARLQQLRAHVDPSRMFVASHDLG
jgi:FAD/FMN-containing dehydrogenase